MGERCVLFLVSQQWPFHDSFIFQWGRGEHTASVGHSCNEHFLYCACLRLQPIVLLNSITHLSKISLSTRLKVSDSRSATSELLISYDTAFHSLGVLDPMCLKKNCEISIWSFTFKPWQHYLSVDKISKCDANVVWSHSKLVSLPQNCEAILWKNKAPCFTTLPQRK